MSTMAIHPKSIRAKQTNRKPAPLSYFLGFISALFIGILIFCYIVTKRTTLIYLDEHGKPVSSDSSHHRVR